MTTFTRRYAHKGDYRASDSAGILKELRKDLRRATTFEEVTHVRDQARYFGASRTITPAQLDAFLRSFKAKVDKLEPEIIVCDDCHTIHWHLPSNPCEVLLTEAIR